MTRSTFLVAAALALATITASPAQTTEKLPFLHPLFSDGAVLQRAVKVPVWGWAEPGEKITVEFGGQTKSATAGADGKWMATLDAMRVSSEPRELVVTGSSADHKSKIGNVLVGDVWLCSGQSNMEMGIGVCDVPNEVASANFPQIRLLTVTKAVKYEPIPTTTCKWDTCTPQTVVAGGWGGFSAVGFFFGRELHKTLNVPIGLIHSSWGGTICEAWASAEGLAPLADFKASVAGVAEIAEQNRKGPRTADAVEAWYTKFDPGTRDGFSKSDTDDAAWKTMELPNQWENAGLPNYDGLAWFRKSFDVPAEWAGKNLTLSLGPIDDIDTTYFNGVKIGSKELWSEGRVYKVPGNLVKAGRNVIAIRVLDNAGGGGIFGKPDQMKLSLSDNAQASVSLAGPWKFKETTGLGNVVGSPAATMNNNPNVTTVLFNGMIAPLLPYAIKGAIWYQGESNAGRGKQYRALLPAMITDWRAHFGVGDFPFYIVSLANFMQPRNEPGDDAWAELREAQAMTAKNLKNCGLAVAIDIGDAGDIHPKNKMEVGRRLALNALAKDYGQKIEFSGPVYRDMKIADAAIRLNFDHADGLIAKGEKLIGFAIAGEDKKFVWADAKVDGASIVVSAAGVAKPVAVRYAWEANPRCNLFNGAGLPAVPFRTDEWPGVTDNAK